MRSGVWPVATATHNSPLFEHIPLADRGAVIDVVADEKTGRAVVRGPPARGQPEAPDRPVSQHPYRGQASIARHFDSPSRTLRRSRSATMRG